MSKILSAAIYSSFNAAQFARMLQNDAGSPPIDVRHIHGMLFGGAFSGAAPLPPEDVDISLVVTTPQSVLPSIARLLDGFSCDVDALLHEVDTFAGTVDRLNSKLVFVASWIAPNRYGGGLLALDPRYGLHAAMSAANRRLEEALHGSLRCRLLNAGAWQTRLGERALSPKSWYLTKDPYAFECWKLAVSDVKSAALALLGRAKKLIVLDLDNTLWGGEVGDVGVDGLRLGGHDPVGEAYADFQRELLSLSRRGVVLGVASKNDEGVALAAIDTHPEMVLRREHLAGWMIDWEDKADNVRALCERLAIDPADAVLIDDNPIERAAVSAALPELTVPDWPSNPMLFVDAIRRLSVFDVPGITSEDLARNRNYVVARRVRERAGSGAHVETRIDVRNLQPADFVRVLQLFNKTSQVNLVTRRFADRDLREWLQDDRHVVKIVRVADSFADYGIVGIVSLEISGETCTISDFVMSCRVMFRGVEERMLETARAEGLARGCSVLQANFVPTSRNEPMRRFLVERSGLLTTDGRRFTAALGGPVLAPA